MDLQGAVDHGSTVPEEVILQLSQVGPLWQNTRETFVGFFIQQPITAVKSQLTVTKLGLLASLKKMQNFDTPNTLIGLHLAFLCHFFLFVTPSIFY